MIKLDFFINLFPDSYVVKGMFASIFANYIILSVLLFVPALAIIPLVHHCGKLKFGIFSAIPKCRTLTVFSD